MIKTTTQKLDVNWRFMVHLLGSKDFKLVAIILKKSLNLLGEGTVSTSGTQQSKITNLIGQTKTILQNFEIVNALMAVEDETID